jgi:hypothetical protein
MGGSYGVYGDRFAGTGQKHSLRYNSHITVVTGDTEVQTTWSEFVSTHGASANICIRALEFDGVFPGDENCPAVRVGWAKPKPTPLPVYCIPTAAPKTPRTLDELRAFVATLDFFGKPVARERGVPPMPWVPAVEYGDNPVRPEDFASIGDEAPPPRRRYRIENLGGLRARDGYATREEAIAKAQQSIDWWRELLANKLNQPRNRDVRGRLGLPEDWPPIASRQPIAVDPNAGDRVPT